MTKDLARMWIDVRPPQAPEPGDVWIARGVIRRWGEDGWDPEWIEPFAVAYERIRRRKKGKRVKKVDAAG